MPILLGPLVGSGMKDYLSNATYNDEPALDKYKAEIQRYFQIDNDTYNKAIQLSHVGNIRY